MRGRIYHKQVFWLDMGNYLNGFLHRLRTHCTQSINTKVFSRRNDQLAAFDQLKIIANLHPAYRTSLNFVNWYPKIIYLEFAHWDPPKVVLIVTENVEGKAGTRHMLRFNSLLIWCRRIGIFWTLLCYISHCWFFFRVLYNLCIPLQHSWQIDLHL